MQEIAKILLDLKAVLLRPEDPFTWASGILSPIYCDNRLVLSYPEERKILEHAFIQLVQREFSDVEMLMGTATAGIPHAAIIADHMNLPMGYVRSSSKAHGRQNQIEGAVREDMKVVVIEDLISTGGSSIAAVKTLQEAGCHVLGVAAIFSYLLPESEENFRQLGVPLHTLTNYDELITVAQRLNYIQKEDRIRLTRWKENPHEESWING